MCRSRVVGFCIHQKPTCWSVFLWIKKQTWEHRRCNTWVRPQLIHPNVLSLPLAPRAPRGILRNRAAQGEHKVLNTTELFTINISFPLIRIHYWHSCDDPTGATTASGSLLPLQRGLLPSAAMPVAWEHSIIHGITVFSTVAAGPGTWAAWVPWCFIIDKEICF